MVPSVKECLNLMDEHTMLENIVRHSFLVKKVALYLAEELNKNGESLDLCKVQAGALLHDIIKTRSIATGEDHAKAGSELLTGLGFKGISGIVRQHVIIEDEISSPVISETEVVNYADKRVMHDKVVVLEDRFDDLRKRYGTNEESVCLINMSEQNAVDLEKKIFLRLDITPDDLLPLELDRQGSTNQL